MANERELEAIRQCPLFDGISKDDLQDLCRKLDIHARRVKKGEMLFIYNEPVDRTEFIYDGAFEGFYCDAWGHRSLLGTRSDGFLMGVLAVFLPDHRSPFNVTALTDCTVVALNRQATSQLLADPTVNDPASRQLLYNMAVELSINLSETLTRMSFLAQQRVRDRILMFLSKCAKDAHSSSFEVDMTRQQIADYLSMDRSTLSEELSRMRDEGLIEVHKGKFKLLV